MSEAAKAAELFHDTYERLAPDFGYETRKDTKVFDPESPNGRLMIAVCGHVLDATHSELEQLRERVKELEARFQRPIVCICGSTRFKQTWIAENARLTGEGQIVLAVGFWGHHERKFPDAVTKEALDDLHKRKIDLCDWVWVLDVDGYIGDSTRSEIAYAESIGKPVRYLSQEFPNYAEPIDQIAADLTTANQRIAELEGENGRLRDLGNRQREQIGELNELHDCKEALRELGRYCGCDHVEHADDRSAQVSHIEEAFDSLTTQLTAANEKCERLEQGIAALDKSLFQNGSYLEYTHGKLLLFEGPDLECSAESAAELINKLGGES